MLFLAVFCGFLAEYQLEHKIEKQRAGDYALSLHRDIKADTLIYNNTVKSLTACINKIDSLILLLDNTETIDKNTASIYSLSLYAFIFPTYKPNEATMQQLLNSGSLRYFKNSLLVDTIKQFNAEVQLFNAFGENTADFNLEFRKMQARLIEIDPLIRFLGSSNILEVKNANIDSISNFTDAMLISSDPILIKEYVNWCALKKFYMQNTVAKYNVINSVAEGVLRMLNSTYHLN